MQKHTEIYLNAFPLDFHVCEVCASSASDIHHIYCRGMGGGKQVTANKNCIENLMALCSRCHKKYGDEVQHYDFLIGIHRDFMDLHEVPWNEEKFEQAKKK